MKKWTAVVLIGMLLFPNNMVFAKELYNDTQGHWAENAIATWSNRNVLNGYNGFFRPDDTVTRGEMAVILNNIMDYRQKSENVFTDLDENFYTEPILKAAKAGILVGDESIVRPKDTMSRQEAVVMLSRALGLTGESGNTNFIDDGQIAQWAKGYVKEMESKGYIKGSDDEAFHPTEAISRSEVVALLDNAIQDIITKDSTISSQSEKSVIINTEDVVLKDSVIKGDLILSEGVDEGDVTLQNVTVEGKLIVRGGGVNTVKIENSNINAISVEKEKSSVRLLAQNSDIALVDITTSAILEGNFKSVLVTDSTDVIVSGSIADMDIKEPANVEVEGNIASINIEENAIGTVVKGEGSVENITVQAEGVSIEIKQTNVTVAEKVSEVMVNGETVTGGTKITTDKQTTAENEKSSSNNNKPSGGSSSGGGSSGGSSSGGNGSQNGNTTEKQITIEKVTPVTNGLIRVTLSQEPKQVLTKEDFSIICTGGGSDMTILNVRTEDNKVYDLTTSYYKDNTYNIQIKLGENEYINKDFEIKYDCAELSLESVERKEQTMAEFTYVSDTPGTLYYSIMKKEQETDTMARNLISKIPTAEELIANGTKSEMKLKMNTVSITGLEPDTAYTLYYVAVDVKDRITPVKEIEIEAKAIEKPPVIPDVIQYDIVSIQSYKDMKAQEGKMYWYAITFDKAVEEELTIEQFQLTCPTQSDLHLGEVEKIDDTTYHVYMKAGYIPFSGNTFTMKVAFKNGTSCEKSFYFDVETPIVEIVAVTPTSENTIDVELNAKGEGYLYYKIYDDDSQFGDISAKDPEDIYKTGVKKEISYGTNILTDIEAKEGQRFCYATENENGSQDSTFYYSEPIKKYEQKPEQMPDEDALEITKVEVLTESEIDIYFNKDFEEAIGSGYHNMQVDISNLNGGRPLYSTSKKDSTVLSVSIINGVTLQEGEHILTITLPDNTILRTSFETAQKQINKDEMITEQNLI